MVGVTHTHTHTLNMDQVTCALQASTMLAGPWMMSGRQLLTLLSFPPCSLFPFLDIEGRRFVSTRWTRSLSEFNLFSPRNGDGVKVHFLISKRDSDNLSGTEIVAFMFFSLNLLNRGKLKYQSQITKM